MMKLPKLIPRVRTPSGWILGLLVLQFLLPAEAISWPALLLFRQSLANHRLTSRPQAQVSWGAWGMWTQCTSTTDHGIRVRSRSCEGSGSCEKLRGDNYQMQACTNSAPEAHNQKMEFTKACTTDGELRNTISCKLYIENATMAYGIYRTTGCLLKIMDDSNYEGDESKFVFGRQPRTKSGEVSASYQENIQFRAMTSGRFRFDGDTQPRGVSQTPTATPRGSLLSNYVTGLTINQYCTDTCQKIVVRATGISSFGSQAPTTVDGILQLLATDSVFQGNPSSISNEYSFCITECLLLGAQYGAARLSLQARGRDRTSSNTDLSINIATVEEGTGSNSDRRRRSANTNGPEDLVPRTYELTSQEAEMLLQNLHLSSSGNTDATSQKQQVRADQPANEVPTLPSDTREIYARIEEREGNDTNILREKLVGKKRKTTVRSDVPPASPQAPTNISAVLSRVKRQSGGRWQPSSYRTPCYVREQTSSSPIVLNTDDTRGELFFFEGNKQKFLRKRCVGQELLPGKLYLPSETVLQERTKQRAVCKQGYLKRFGLMINYDPEGEFSFADGQRFSVKLKTFKLESHCALTVFV